MLVKFRKLSAGDKFYTEYDYKYNDIDDKTHLLLKKVGIALAVDINGDYVDVNPSDLVHQIIEENDE